MFIENKEVKLAYLDKFEGYQYIVRYSFRSKYIRKLALAYSHKGFIILIVS